MTSNTSIDDIYPDENNPRRPDSARMHLLKLSLQKLGYVLPIYTTPAGMILSGHQRWTASKEMGLEHVPTQEIEMPESRYKGLNVLFNRVTNDFTAFDTGEGVSSRLDLQDIMSLAEEIDDFQGEDWYALHEYVGNITGLGRRAAHRYDKKAARMADQVRRQKVRIPIIITESAEIVNGVHRLFSAREAGDTTWPIIEIPDDLGNLASNLLNYLSMDYHVNEQFQDMLRASAYRRPQNNRGAVPKAYRFWANGERTLPDKESYSREYWRNFRELHGSVLDFGGGLCKTAPYLRKKGIEAIDFEPYRINQQVSKSKPDIELSKQKAKEFLDQISDGRRFDSIFLASVMNSIPLPRDRMCVLAIVHALCDYDTIVYGTCRDISDFEYEYAGIRNAGYFVFDSEPGVRLGDSLENPKIQKFHTKKEATQMFKTFWTGIDYWPGGNIFYFRCMNPKRRNLRVLHEALEFEFDLPYHDGTRMGLVDYAIKSFEKRLGLKLE